MNVLEVYNFTRRAVDQARDECRPSFLVFDTYRFSGHHTSDSEHYREKSEVVAEFRQHDPIHFVERQVFDECELDPERLVDMRLEARDEIDAAFERALQAPWPENEVALRDVYV